MLTPDNKNKLYRNIPFSTTARHCPKQDKISFSPLYKRSHLFPFFFPFFFYFSPLLSLLYFPSFFTSKCHNNLINQKLD